MIEMVDYDPYPSFELMRTEVETTNRLLITTKNNESIFDPWVNLCFRAVHDADHLKHTHSFQIHGEKGACRTILNRCGDVEGRLVLFCEIYAQACVQHVTGRFAPQKFVEFEAVTVDRALFS